MTHESTYEAVNRTLQDITGVQRPMGGIPTLLCGDFCQILPVVKRGTRANIVNASIKTSDLWHHVTVKHLTTNMRTANSFVWFKGLQTLPNFSWNLAMDRSHLRLNQTPSQSLLGWERLSRHWRSSRLKCTSAWIPMLTIMSGWLSGQFYRLWTSMSTTSILGSRLSSLVKGNLQICGQCHLRWGSSYLSCWAAQLHWVVRNASTYTQPQDRVPIMILRNMEPPKTTNGTRCIVTHLHANVIEAAIFCGPYKGEVILLPRFPLIPSDSELPFQFRRLQFPCKPCFSMSINKSQGQTVKATWTSLSHVTPIASYMWLPLGLAAHQN